MTPVMMALVALTVLGGAATSYCLALIVERKRLLEDQAVWKDMLMSAQQGYYASAVKAESRYDTLISSFNEERESLVETMLALKVAQESTDPTQYASATATALSHLRKDLDIRELNVSDHIPIPEADSAEFLSGAGVYDGE